jgi:hypothetical protein
MKFRKTLPKEIVKKIVHYEKTDSLVAVYDVLRKIVAKATK